MDAAEYNRAQKLNPDDIVRIQRTVGAVADGVIGAKTIAKIVAWQREQGLDGDGRLGPGTLAALRRAWESDDDFDGDEAIDDVPDGAGLVVLDTSAEWMAAVQNDLFAFGFEPGQPDGQPGSRTRQAIAAFQAAARSPLRVVGDSRRVFAPTFRGSESPGELDTETIAELARWKAAGYRWVAPGAEYVERRVRVENYGRLPRSSRLLVDVPGTQGKPRRLHRLAAAALSRMVAAAKADVGLELLVQSGWRAHRWTSRDQYEETLRAKYGSVARGRIYLAFDSPHETGLAVDFGSDGLFPVSSTIAAQRKTVAHAWLHAHAWRFGWTPYAAEPWHWEHALSSRAWSTGDSDWG